MYTPEQIKQAFMLAGIPVNVAGTIGPVTFAMLQIALDRLPKPEATK